MNTLPKIVLIEDNPLVRAAEKMLLEDAGYHVDEIASASELAVFAAVPGMHKAIIADFDLGPGMTGIEMALDIMKRCGEHIPTLVLSAHAADQLSVAAAAHHMPIMVKAACIDKVIDWLNDTLAMLTRQGQGGDVS